MNYDLMTLYTGHLPISVELYQLATVPVDSQRAYVDLHILLDELEGQVDTQEQQNHCDEKINCDDLKA
jgi:hypothetical protein